MRKPAFEAGFLCWLTQLINRNYNNLKNNLRGIIKVEKKAFVVFIMYKLNSGRSGDTF